MTFSPNQLVICVAPRKGGWLRKGRVYRVVSVAQIGWDDAIEVEGSPSHHFASRFRAISDRQHALVKSIITAALVNARLPQIGGGEAA